MRGLTYWLPIGNSGARQSLALCVYLFAGLRPAPYPRGEYPLGNLYDRELCHCARKNDLSRECIENYKRHILLLSAAECGEGPLRILRLLDRVRKIRLQHTLQTIWKCTFDRTCTSFSKVNYTQNCYICFVLSNAVFLFVFYRTKRITCKSVDKTQFNRV
jgi:hypothetical protein